MLIVISVDFLSILEDLILTLFNIHYFHTLLMAELIELYIRNLDFSELYPLCLNTLSMYFNNLSLYLSQCLLLLQIAAITNLSIDHNSVLKQAAAETFTCYDLMAQHAGT